MKHDLDEFEYVDVDGEETGAPRVTKKELLEEGNLLYNATCSHRFDPNFLKKLVN